MISLMRSLCAFFLLLTLSLSASAQLTLRPLQANNKLIEALKKNKYALKASKVEAIKLPFIDDFSGEPPFPNPALWQNQQVFINNTYPFYPPTKGVATFDAFDQRGWVYSQALTSGGSFPADTLLSQAIRLDSIFYPEARPITSEDSLYFSFYYQPGGGEGPLWDPSRRGSTPLKEDVLVLEFFESYLETWIPVWQTNGESLEEFRANGKNYFKLVMIPFQTDLLLDNPQFLFRFRAFSSIYPNYLSGGGQWHIDYVYLNIGRSIHDTTFNDLAFVESSSSLLKNHQQVPFRQFVDTMLVSTATVLPTNLSNEVLPATYQYRIMDHDGNIVYAQPAEEAANTNIFPYIDFENRYQSDPDINNFPMEYSFAEAYLKECSFTIEHILKSSLENDLIPQNDTIRFIQNFGHTFAYDDGSSEAAIGLTYPGKMAYRFELLEPDTLTAVNLCINHSYDNQNDAAFKICVWTCGEDGKPGDLLYETESMSVQIFSVRNAFGQYRFTEDVLLDKGCFFVGIEQLGNTYPNFGFDQNHDARTKLYYTFYDNTTYKWEWENPLFYGAWMLRPAFGEKGKVNNEESAIRKPTEKNKLHLYPNPLKGSEIHIVLPENCSANHTRLSILDMMGRCLYEKSYTPSVALNHFQNGVYILRLQDMQSGCHFSSQLIIVR